MNRIIYISQVCMLTLMGIYGSAMAQDSQIQGLVIDIDGNPVVGAKIHLVEDETIVSLSNRYGQFEIAGELGHHLKVENRGQVTEPIRISQNQMSVILPVQTNQISVGYGEYRSSNSLTGAVGFITGNDIPNNSVINPENTLYGKIPGLIALQNGGEPPTGATFNIRGVETFRNNQPLILVDGFERPLSSLSTDEIQNISVLKDAALLSMYGQRGANGVILVETKRGEADQLRVNASFETSITEPVGLPKFVQAPTYARAINEALLNDGLDPRYSNGDIDAFSNNSSPVLFPNVNWFDEVLRDQGTRQTFNISFDGGSSRARYYVLMNYSSDNGLFGPVNRNEDFSTQLKYGQFNFRSNLDIEVSESLALQINAAGNIVNRNTPSGGDGPNEIFNSLYRIPSAAFPVQTMDGSWGGSPLYGTNPVAMLTSTGYGSPNERELFLDSRLIKNLDNVTKGLSAELALSYNNFASYFEQQSKQYSYESVIPVRDQSGTVVDVERTVFGEDTELGFWSSFGNQRRSTDILGKIRYETLLENSELTAVALFHQSGMTLDGQNNTFRRNNFAGSLLYGYDQTYYVNVAVSYNGNNILPSNDRYGLFPAVSASWLISNEDFMADNSLFDLLKLRASWGVTGNDLIPNGNLHLQNYSGSSGYFFTDNNTFSGGTSESRLATADFTYETSYTTNLGVDIGLLENLFFTADLFYAKRKNILTNSGGRISNVLGVTAPLESNGVVENRGVEFDLEWRDTVSRDFAYYIGGQMTFTRNKILEMNEAFQPYDYLKETGRSVGQRFGLEAIGFFADQEDITSSPDQRFSQVRPGDIKYRDQNGDGIINEFDVVPVGYSSQYPELYFSASVGFNYKGIGVESLFQGTGNYTAYLNTPSVYWPLRNNNTLSEYYYENRWTSEGSADAIFPRLTTLNNENNNRPNDIWLVDRSYIKLRTLEVSYTLPVSFVQSLSMQRIKIYGRGMNLFSIDNIEIMDPEHLGTGYPTLRSYHLGLNIVF